MQHEFLTSKRKKIKNRININLHSILIRIGFINLKNFIRIFNTSNKINFMKNW